MRPAKKKASRMRWVAVGGAVWLAVAGVLPAEADDVSDKLDAARGAYGKGDALRALEALQSVEGALTAKLVDQYARTLPPAPPGWEASAADSQELDTVGGGLSVTRGYQKGEAALNVTLLIDNPAVANTLALFKPASPGGAAAAGWKAVKIGTEDAMLRFDAANREGEIALAVQNRAALEIEGSEIATEQALIDLAKGWNVALLKKLLGP